MFAVALKVRGASDLQATLAAPVDMSAFVRAVTGGSRTRSMAWTPASPVPSMSLGPCCIRRFPNTIVCEKTALVGAIPNEPWLEGQCHDCLATVASIHD